METDQKKKAPGKMEKKPIEYEDDLSSDEEYDEEEFKDDLDMNELQEYSLLRAAEERIKKMSQEPGKVAKLILRTAESINKSDLIQAKLEELQKKSGCLQLTSESDPKHIKGEKKEYAFLNFLNVSSVGGGHSIKDVENDVERETEFYELTMNATREAVKKLDTSKHFRFPVERPDDFFAEMVKSDEHMAQVKKALLKTQQDIEKRETSRKNLELKRFGKAIQIERIKQKLEEKKQNLSLLKNWKKMMEGGKKGSVNVEELEKTLKNNPEVAAAMVNNQEVTSGKKKAESVFQEGGWKVKSELLGDANKQSFSGVKRKRAGRLTRHTNRHKRRKK